MPDVIGTIGTGTHFPCNHKSGLFILYRDSTPLYAGLMFMGASSKLRACWVISILLCETLWPQQYICGWSPPLVKKPCLLLKSLALPSSIPEVLCFTTHCCWWNDSCRIVWCCLFTVWNMYQQNWAICGVSMSVNLSLEHSEYLNQPKIFNQRRQRLTALPPQRMALNEALGRQSMHGDATWPKSHCLTIKTWWIYCTIKNYVLMIKPLWFNRQTWGLNIV